MNVAKLKRNRATLKMLGGGLLARSLKGVRLDLDKVLNKSWLHTYVTT